MGILGHPGFDGDGRPPRPDWWRLMWLVITVTLVTAGAFTVTHKVTARDAERETLDVVWDDAKVYPLYHSGMKTEEAPL